MSPSSLPRPWPIGLITNMSASSQNQTTKAKGSRDAGPGPLTSEMTTDKLE